jgi:hypothetical protein
VLGVEALNASQLASAHELERDYETIAVSSALLEVSTENSLSYSITMHLCGVEVIHTTCRLFHSFSYLFLH